MSAARKLAPAAPTEARTIPATRADLRDLYLALRDELGPQLYREPRPPPPHDLDAQARVLAAVLRSRDQAGDLDGLGSSHFFGDLDAQLYDLILGARASARCDDVVAWVAGKLGYRVDVRGRLETLRYEWPIADARQLREDVERITGLARRRQALEASYQLEHAIRHGDDDEVTAAVASVARAMEGRDG